MVVGKDRKCERPTMAQPQRGQEKPPPKLRRARPHSMPRPLFRFHFIYTKMKAIQGEVKLCPAVGDTMPGTVWSIHFLKVTRP